MKLSLKVFILVFVCFVQVLAGELKVEEVKTLGLMKHKVIFQERILKKVKGEKIYSGKLIARWGTQVYELVEGFYSCDLKKSCELVEYERIATFESCVVEGERAECHTVISRDTYSSSSDYDDSTVGVSFGEVDEFPSRSRISDRDYDGEQRSYDEYDDLF